MVEGWAWYAPRSIDVALAGIKARQRGLSFDNGAWVFSVFFALFHRVQRLD